MSSQTTENGPKTNAFRKLDNDSQNYSIWAPSMVLQGLELWAIVDPTTPTSVQPITLTPVPASICVLALATVAGSVPAPMLDAALELDRKNAKTLSLLLTSIDDTPFHLISVKTTARDAWITLSICYNGLGALDASILSTHLH